MQLHRALLAIPAVVLCLGGCSTSRPVDSIRLNQIQVIGSHNSYHQRAPESVRTLLQRQNPQVAGGLDYHHPPLAEQFARLGIRQIELDCFADPHGGLYAKPRGIEWATNAGLPPVASLDPDGKLLQPGIKVLHVPDVDYASSVMTLKDGLRELVEWSRKHPDHVPILVLLELKEEAESPQLTQPIPFGDRELAGLEAEIRAVVPLEHILTPDQVRHGERTLPEALQKHGWPRLDSVRGKIMLAMDNEGEVRDRYLKGHPALEGRLLFVSVPATHPAAAWMKRNDPISEFDQIQELVRAGFLVRTRADADTRQARTHDPIQRDRAFASGAQFVSTDYAEPDLRWSPYRVQFTNGIVARPNPVSAGSALREVDLERR